MIYDPNLTAVSDHALLMRECELSKHTDALEIEVKQLRARTTEIRAERAQEYVVSASVLENPSMTVV